MLEGTVASVISYPCAGNTHPLTRLVSGVVEKYEVAI